MDFAWIFYLIFFRLLLTFYLCWTLLHCMFMIYCLAWTLCFEVLVWFVICDELCWLVILLWFMFILWACWGRANHVKISYHIYILCCIVSISTCRGNSVKFIKIHIYVLLVFIQIYKHISRGSSLYLSNLGEFIHIIFWNFQEKWVSSFKVQFQVHIMPSV